MSLCHCPLFLVTVGPGYNFSSTYKLFLVTTVQAFGAMATADLTLSHYFSLFQIMHGIFTLIENCARKDPLQFGNIDVKVAVVPPC
jgi:hypothetical protein